MTDLPTSWHQVLPASDKPSEQWIKARAISLLGHYYRPEQSVAEEKLALADWCDVLRDLPQEAIARACISRIGSDDKSRPTPGEIRHAAKALIASHAPTLADDRPFAPVIIPESELQRRREMCAELADEFPSLRRITGLEGE